MTESIPRPIEEYIMAKLDSRARINAYFNLLTPREKAAIIAYADGMSMPEIAEAFGRETNTIWQAIERARKKGYLIWEKNVLEGRKSPVHQRETDMQIIYEQCG